MHASSLEFLHSGEFGKFYPQYPQYSELPIVPRFGVREYWQYDPTGDYLQPRLQGLHLVAGNYRRIMERGSAAGRQEMYGSVLGLELRVSERGFRFHDPVVGEDLLSLTERREALQREQQARERAERGWQRAEQDRQRERQARQEAEARVAELEARLRDRGSAER